MMSYARRAASTIQRRDTCGIGSAVDVYVCAGVNIDVLCTTAAVIDVRVLTSVVAYGSVAARTIRCFVVVGMTRSRRVVVI